MAKGKKHAVEYILEWDDSEAYDDVEEEDNSEEEEEQHLPDPPSKRSRTKLAKIVQLPKGNKTPLEQNAKGYPVGESAKLSGSFIGVKARELFPIDVTRLSQIPKCYAPKWA